MREPVGVVAAITPWNYPLHQIAAKVAPALAAGCTVVLKPSEVAPLNAFILAEIIDAAGLPAGVFNLISGTGASVGEALVCHPDVDMVSFTGSTRAGRRIAELAAGTVKRVALELGGKSASVVLDDADLAAAIKTTVNVCFLNSGQTCNALTRLLVPESRYEEAAQLAVEVGQDLQRRRSAGRRGQAGAARVRGAARAGARLHPEGHRRKARSCCSAARRRLPGSPRATTSCPTVFGRVKPDATIAQEEIFGPVLSIIPYRDEDDAVRIANGTIYGLAGGGVVGRRSARPARRAPPACRPDRYQRR